MSDALRRLHNRIAGLVDRRSLRAEVRIERSSGAAEPKTARSAFQLAAGPARRLDRTLRLKHVSAPAGVDVDGRATHWSFLFDLPRRRAQVRADWSLVHDGWTRARVSSIALPFPPLGGLVRRQIDEGRIVYRQMQSHWIEERARTPDLPVPFVDSDRAVDALVGLGLDAAIAELRLATGVDADGAPVWIGASRDREETVPFDAAPTRPAA
ncbi:MAG: hypothetical protein AAGB93_20580 [Planctomycetota bacterium]